MLAGCRFMEKNDVLIECRRKCLKLGSNDVEVFFIDSNRSGNNRMELRLLGNGVPDCANTSKLSYY